LGFGGVTTELYHDVALRLLPLDRTQAFSMINELKSAALLKGFRGRPCADIEALVDAILRFADMVAALGGSLQEAEINPLFVLPEGKGVRAADGLVVLQVD
jgi:acyl-CoA synthetase (NDP forming)